ncbi:hypothetical protein [Metabacillus sp. RGM 3146]|uniref:hypothetical protein n=1 Tax=Metabacillus sp. RGM 3146 TaxID=3401092 RepID=UPI003B9CAD8D
MTHQGVEISILGSAGAAARAVLFLLNKLIMDPLDPLHSLMNQSMLHFIERDLPYSANIAIMQGSFHL